MWQPPCLVRTIALAVPLIVWHAAARGADGSVAVSAAAASAGAAELSRVRGDSARCLAAIAAAEGRRGTAPGLLAAIGRAESGRPIPPLPGLQPWPWAVNADGGAYYFGSKQQAVDWVRRALEGGARQVDVGCMQINLQSHPRAFTSLEEAFEPASNADYAARFLSRLREDAGGNWYLAVGYYHSRTPELAADYRVRVAEIAAGRVPAVGLGLPLYMQAIRQGTLRITLPGGGVMRLNLARQPRGRARGRPSACRVAMLLGSYMAPRARAAACAPPPASADSAARSGTPG